MLQIFFMTISRRPNFTIKWIEIQKTFLNRVLILIMMSNFWTQQNSFLLCQKKIHSNYHSIIKNNHSLLSYSISWYEINLFKLTALRNFTISCFSSLPSAFFSSVCWFWVCAGSIAILVSITTRLVTRCPWRPQCPTSIN